MRRSRMKASASLGVHARRAGVLSFVASGLAVGVAGASDELFLDRAEHADRVRAMWLGQAIANWTGLTTEGGWREPPFLTDADWGTMPRNELIDFVFDQDPWFADDDTDIEYVYQHLMEIHGINLTGEQIADGWIEHINDFIWVSNRNARRLMDRGMVPPETGHGPANGGWNKIDAQLTTEFFGALAPGMPELTMQLAELPIRNTAWTYAAHAAQYYAIQYSLAPLVNQSLSGREQAIWLVTEARTWIPDGSKTAEAVDLVLADFLANPDVDDWERTRDLIYDVFQLNDGDNGYFYRGWFESTVNFATGVMALLYGEMDFQRTLQIGTLSGWDSDNPTATIGGLLGLVHGYDGLIAQLPAGEYSDRFWIHRTRPTMPDLLPDDPEAEDTFSAMASRFVELVDSAVIQGGGAVDEVGGRWLIPPMPAVEGGTRAHLNPQIILDERSANNRLRRQGSSVNGWLSVTPDIPSAALGNPDPRWMVNGFAMGSSGVDQTNAAVRFVSTFGSGTEAGVEHTVRVNYGAPVEAYAVLFAEGNHFPRPDEGDTAEGGWFESIRVEVRVDGVWTPVNVTPSKVLSTDVPFEIVEFVLDTPMMVTGAQLAGVPGGPDRFVTVSEIDVLASPPVPALSRYDVNGDGVVDVEDLYAQAGSPTDINGDGVADADDTRQLERFVRFNERADLRGGR